MERPIDDRSERTHQESGGREELSSTGRVSPAATGSDTPGGLVGGAPAARAAYSVEQGSATGASAQIGVADEGERRLEVREEQLVARKEMREVGEVRVRTQVEEVPGRLEIDAYREEVEVEHVPVGQVVTERVAPWEENGVLVVPVYEEQLVVVKRLLLREHLKIRRVGTTERQLFEDTLRRERLVIEDPTNSALVHEQFPATQEQGDRSAEAAGEKPDEAEREEGGFLGNLVKKAFL